MQKTIKEIKELIAIFLFVMFCEKMSGAKRIIFFVHCLGRMLLKIKAGRVFFIM